MSHKASRNCIVLQPCASTLAEGLWPSLPGTVRRPLNLWGVKLSVQQEKKRHGSERRLLWSTNRKNPPAAPFLPFVAVSMLALDVPEATKARHHRSAPRRPTTRMPTPRCQHLILRCTPVEALSNMRTFADARQNKKASLKKLPASAEACPAPLPNGC